MSNRRERAVRRCSVDVLRCRPSRLKLGRGGGGIHVFCEHHLPPGGIWRLGDAVQVSQHMSSLAQGSQPFYDWQTPTRTSPWPSPLGRFAVVRSRCFGRRESSTITNRHDSLIRVVTSGRSHSEPGSLYYLQIVRFSTCRCVSVCANFGSLSRPEGTISNSTVIVLAVGIPYEPSVDVCLLSGGRVNPADSRDAKEIHAGYSRKKSKYRKTCIRNHSLRIVV